MLNEPPTVTRSLEKNMKYDTCGRARGATVPNMRAYARSLAMPAPMFAAWTATPGQGHDEQPLQDRDMTNRRCACPPGWRHRDNPRQQHLPLGPAGLTVVPIKRGMSGLLSVASQIVLIMLADVYVNP